MIKLIIEDNKQVIFYNLKYGINLPVKKEFKDYVIPELENLNAKAIYILTENDRKIGHCLFYKFDNILYFGFFSFKYKNKIIGKAIIENLIKIAKEEKCNIIRGPINLPPYIYGFGFSEEGSDPSIFCGTPYTDPSYIELFKNEGFELWHRLLWLRVEIKSKLPYEKVWDIKNPDLNSDDWIDPFLELQAKYFPESARITPKRNKEVVLAALKFLKKYGSNKFIYLAYDNNNKLIGLGYAMPNPFDLKQLKTIDITQTCRTNSALLFGGVVDPEYQKHKIMFQIFGEFFDYCLSSGIKIGECVLGEDNIASKTLLEKLGGNVVRKYQILQKRIFQST